MGRRKSQKSMKRSSRSRTRSSAQGDFFRFLFKWGLVAGLWLIIGVGLLTAWYARDLPDITEAMVFERRPTITVKAADGSVLQRYGDIKGESLRVEDLPPYLTYAILAVEDRRFYEHFGLDPWGVLRAFIVNVTRGSVVQGGSTITQQLAKNLFLSKDRTLKRKIQEALLAIWLERTLTKDEILSAYLNRVYLGSGAYGIDAAARVYYNKPATALTLRESATLAGLLKAPSRYSPAANPDLAAQRTQVVLNSMVDAGFIDKEQIDSLSKIPPSPRRKPSSGDTVRYFTDYIVSQLDDLIGTPDRDVVIETTLDVDVQNAAEAALTKGLLANADKNVSQGAVVVLRLDGAVTAMVGGRDYGMSEFNRATHALRSPGSSFKPVVYLTALEMGWRPSDLIVDEPMTEGKYRPQNYKGEYMGEVTLLEALTFSLNTVAVKLIQAVGPEAVIGTARRLGITANLEPNLSLALGSNGVPIIEMATAYAALGRGGYAVQPFSILRISDEEGSVYYEHTGEAFMRQVVSAQNINQITMMMRSVVDNGTGQGARFGVPVAGKTGTSQEFRDAWFIGFTDRYAAAVWVGNDDNSSMKRITGGSIPASVWRETMQVAQSKGGPSQRRSGFFQASTDFGFDNMISRLLGGDSFESPLEKVEAAPQPSSTPLGRHQWQFND